MLLALPFMAAGIRFEEGEDRRKVTYQAAHHELVASALAVKIGHELAPNAMIGCMLAGGNYYPYSCRPEDVWESICRDRDNYFFIDVQSRGEYPAFALKQMEREGVMPVMEPGDLDILIQLLCFQMRQHRSRNCRKADLRQRFRQHGQSVSEAF